MKRKWLRFLWVLPVLLLGLAAVVFVPRLLNGSGAPLSELLHGGKTANLPKVTPPPDAQVLTYPLETGTVVSGFHNENYRLDKGYEHFAIDITPVFAVDANVLASGTGRVLGTEWCDNSLGNIAVILYEDVYNPTTKTVAPLVARYYHMVSISVKEGDVVRRGDVIGVINGGHQNLNHTHIELDTDTSAPFNTPQVSERSSELLRRHPATGDSIINPFSVLVLGPGQRITIHPLATFCTTEDMPRFRWDGESSTE